jgi:hypothetical protein
MAITRVQTKNSGGLTITSGNGLTFTNPVTALGWIIVTIAYTENGVRSTGVADDLGTAFVQDGLKFGNGAGTEIWRGQAVIGGTNTVRVTFSAVGKTYRMAITEYSVAANASLTKHDQGNSTQATTTTHPQGSVTTTDASELIVTTAGIVGGYTIATNPSGFSTLFSPGTGIQVYERIGGPITTTATFTTSANESSACLNTAYQETIVDPGPLRLTQLHRRTLYIPTSDTIVGGVAAKVRLTQLHRKVLYPATCSPTPPPPPPPTGCPASNVDPEPVTGDTGCIDDMDPDALT